ncbi:alpha/beta hydrolase family protein [Streptomyces sp. NPDC004311]|uniref:alpha/beta hydrolase family protein n=1 Tax=Streptomyces sp. NPDC004311 TaxID=3364698 RepID=UPI003674DA5A
MNKIIRVLVAVAAGLVLVAPGALVAPAVAHAAPAVGPTGLELPRPTGGLAVGRDTLHLVDRDRKDPWVPARDRELLLSLYYPALAHTGTPAPYMSVPEAKALLTDRGTLADHVTPERLAATRTNARTGAVPRPSAHGYPLVVLSPGFTMPRASLTVLAEDVASRGYVVAAVDHAYESDGTSFPGGRVLTCMACEQVFPDRSLERVSDGRARDIPFVLDRLTGPRPAWRHSRLMIDAGRIGMAGHSIGGAAASASMAADPRVDAGVNMDGTFFTPVPPAGLGGRPFLMLAGDPALLPPDFPDTSWEDNWPRLDGWKRWLNITGAGHAAFTDWPVLGDQVGYGHPETPLSGLRSQQITRGYVGAFFDLHLRGIASPRLEGPTAADPEVVFHRR